MKKSIVLLVLLASSPLAVSAHSAENKTPWSSIPGEALKYIFENFETLKAPQWALIILLSVGLGTSAFYILRWLYRERYEAQGNVIALKEELIKTYSTNMKHLKEHAIDLEIKVEESQREIDTYLDNLTHTGKENEILKNIIYKMYKENRNLRMSIFQLERMRLHWNIVGIQYSLLVEYASNNIDHKVKDSKMTHEILESIDSATMMLRSVEAFSVYSDKEDPLNMKKPARVVPELLKFDFDKLTAQLDLSYGDLIRGLGAFLGRGSIDGRPQD